MEKIKKHKHTHFNLKDAFSFSEELVSKLIPIIKKKPKKTKELFEMAKECIEFGNMLGYPKETILPYMQLCLEAIVGYYRVCSNTGKEVSFTIDGETIKAVANESPNENHCEYWADGTVIATILRDRQKLDELLEIPIDKYYGHQKVNNPILNIYKALLKKENNSAVDWINKLMPLLTDNKEYKRKLWDFIIIPEIKVIEKFISGNEEEFNKTLYNANLMHKKHRGSSEEREKGSGIPRSQESIGFISLPLTALAALAHDRNWTIGFESDYMPTWMIRGEFDK